MASMTGAFVLSGPLSYPHYLDGQGGYACEQAWGRNGPYGMDGPYGLRLSGLSLSGCWYAPRSCCLSTR